MENIFANLKVYGAGKWKEASVRKFNDVELKGIQSAHVEQKDFADGNSAVSVCFSMVGGSRYYIKLDTERSNVGVGEVIDVSKAEIVTLTKEGEQPIQRVRVNQ